MMNQSASSSSLALDDMGMFKTPVTQTEAGTFPKNTIGDQNAQQEEDGLVDDPISKTKVKAFKLISNEHREKLYALMKVVMELFHECHRRTVSHSRSSNPSSSTTSPSSLTNSTNDKVLNVAGQEEASKTLQEQHRHNHKNATHKKSHQVPIIWATGGTVLGAIRHQDIIPWDDDADFCVPKCHFTKFLQHEVVNSEAYFSTSQQQDQNFHPISPSLSPSCSANTNNPTTSPSSSAASANEKQIFLDLIHDLHFNKQVRVEKADRVGLRFFKRGEKYPFVDVFVMQQVQNFEVLKKKYPLVARRVEEFYFIDDDDGENEETLFNTHQPIFVIDDSNGRTAWPDEFWFYDSVKIDDHDDTNDSSTRKPLLIHLPFGPKIPNLPVSCDFLKYLNRTYGSDWNVVAKSNPIQHESKHILKTLTIDLNKAFEVAGKN